MNPQQIAEYLRNSKQPKYRLEQALRSYYFDLLESWEDISTWPKQLREDCKDLAWSPLKLIRYAEIEHPKSTKFLFETHDGSSLESVLMRHDDGRNTVCVSSQIGCAMGCAFCATGKMGIVRNLTAEEIVDQVIQVARMLKTANAKVTNIVYMGMGEPFNNPNEVFISLKILMDPAGFGLGARHISVSTCGIIPGILRLMHEAPQVNLAISLHAVSQSVREKIMPVAKAYPLDKLMRTIREYMEETNRKVMLEYVLLKGINDSTEDAEDLADLINDCRHLAHVNLISYHQTGDFERSPEATERAFMNTLKRRGISVTHRISFGADISAACGQLAIKVIS